MENENRTDSRRKQIGIKLKKAPSTSMKEQAEMDLNDIYSTYRSPGCVSKFDFVLFFKKIKVLRSEISLEILVKTSDSKTINYQAF